MAHVLGVDFNCNASICYGVGANNHALFQQLQQVLNQHGAGLTIDGFIGDATVAAVKIVGGKLRVALPSASRNAVAAGADTIITQLQHSLVAATEPAPPAEIESVVQQAITSCRTDKSSPSCANAKALCKTVHGTPNAKLPGIDELCAVRLPLWARWTLGIVAVGGLAVGGVVAYRHYRRTR